MKRFSTFSWMIPAVLGGVLVLMLSDVALAAEGDQEWRPVYDLVMRWVNFFILFFILFKFGRRPLMDFLRGQRDEIAQEFTKVEAQKEKMLAKLKEASQALEESKVRLPELKTRLIEQGERRKQELIEEAREQSRLIMEGARHKIDYQVLRAREKLSLELLDMAMGEALKRLPALITPEDDKRQVEKFLSIASH
ncbi:MAG: hypothetical protein KFF50_07530 [Desulfatitalea sp.]|nr:hypothetical protein [Desulfatitalea sp.]